MLHLQPTVRLPSKREGVVSCFEWSPDGAWLAEVRAKKGGVRLWSLANSGAGSKPEVGPIAEMPGIVELPSSWKSLRWSPDGRGLSVSAAGQVRVFDVGLDGALTERWTSPCAPEHNSACAAWRPDSSALAIGVRDRVVLLDAQTGASTFDMSLGIGRAFVSALEWNPEPQSRASELAAATSRGLFGIDVDTRAITIDFGSSQYFNAARWWAPDLVYTSDNTRLIAWNPRRGEAAGQAIVPGSITTVSLSADRTLVAAMTRGRLVLLRTPPPSYGPEPATLEIVADLTLTGMKVPRGVWAEFHPTLPQLAVHTANAAEIDLYRWDPADLAG